MSSEGEKKQDAGSKESQPTLFTAHYEMLKEIQDWKTSPEVAPKISILPQDQESSKRRILNRREFMRTLVAASILLVAGASGAYEILALGNKQGQPPPSLASPVSPSSGTQAPSGYSLVAELASLGSKTSAYFTHPSYGRSILIEVSGQWKAFSAVCTHEPCTLEPDGPNLYCPCHGAEFSTSNGAVLAGPAPAPIPEYGVKVVNGAVYVSSGPINY